MSPNKSSRIVTILSSAAVSAVLALPAPAAARGGSGHLYGDAWGEHCGGCGSLEHEVHHHHRSRSHHFEDFHYSGHRRGAHDPDQRTNSDGSAPPSTSGSAGSEHR